MHYDRKSDKYFSGERAQRWKFSTISGRSDFRKVSWFSFSFKTQIWPSRFLERCSHFQFLQITNLAVQIFEKVFTFAFLMKIEMWTPFLYRFGQERCSHFDFHQKRKCEHLSKNLDGQICVLKKKWKCEHVFLYDLFRFAIWNKMKIRTPFENLNGQKLLRNSTSDMAGRRQQFLTQPLEL